MPSAAVGDPDGPGVPSFVTRGAAAHPVTNKLKERKRISTREPCLRCRETACTIRRRLICIRDDARCLASYVPCPGRGKVEGGRTPGLFDTEPRNSPGKCVKQTEMTPAPVV